VSVPNSKCAVLVPVGSSIDPQCDASLRVLESRGYVVRRVYGYAAIDLVRGLMATEALRGGFEELMWIDSDVRFHPDSIERLRDHDLDMVCGIYAKKGTRGFSSRFLEETQEVVFGAGGGVLEIKYAATGFLLTRRAVYDRIREKHGLPLCNESFKQPIVPYFMPMITETPFGTWYLSEDFAFSERARAAGLKVWADTAIRLWHVGGYPHGWEDAGADVKRHAQYRLKLT
jgi:hypothetical protein